MAIYSDSGYEITDRGQDGITLGEVSIQIDWIRRAAVQTNRLMQRINLMTVSEDGGPNLIDILGQTIVSTMISELFAGLVSELSGGQFFSNPHEKGRPDICAVTDEAMDFLEGQGWGTPDFPTGTTRRWQPYPHDGVEVKATRTGKKGTGEMREYRLGLPGSHSISWVAHHGDHPRLIGVLWDFVTCDGQTSPCIVAVFYSDELLGTWGGRRGGSDDSDSTVTADQRPEGVESMLQGALMHPSDEHLRRDYNKVLRYTGDLSEHTPLSITGGGGGSAQGSQSNRPHTVSELEERLEQRGIITPTGATTQCKVVILELADLTQNQTIVVLQPPVISFAVPLDSEAYVQWIQDNDLLLDIVRFGDLTGGGFSRTLMRRAGLVPTGRHLVDASILYFLRGGHVMNDAENLRIRSWLLEPLTEGDTVSTVMRVGSVRVQMERRHDGRPGGELALRIMTSSGE